MEAKNTQCSDQNGWQELQEIRRPAQEETVKTLDKEIFSYLQELESDQKNK